MLYDNICFFGGASEESNLTWLPLYLAHFVLLSHLSYLTTTPPANTVVADPTRAPIIQSQIKPIKTIPFIFTFASNPFLNFLMTVIDKAESK